MTSPAGNTGSTAACRGGNASGGRVIFGDEHAMSTTGDLSNLIGGADGRGGESGSRGWDGYTTDELITEAYRELFHAWGK